MTGPTSQFKLMLLDMDGTLTTVKSPWQYVHEKAGTWDKLGKPLLKRYLAREISYEEFCIQDARAYSEAGLALEQVHDILGTIPIPPVALEFLEFLVENDIRPAIISTGFTCTADRLLTALNLHPKAVDVMANALFEQDGFIVPKLDVIDGHPDKGKAAWADRVLAGYNFPRETVGAVGDSDSDAPLFDRAGRFFKVRGPNDLTAIPWLKIR